MKKAIEYLKLNKEEGYNWGFIRGTWSSIADVAIAQMQDFLDLGNKARVNLPSTLGANWRWRAEKDVFKEELAEKIHRVTEVYGRCEKVKDEKLKKI